MKVLLFITIVFTNGTSVNDSIEFPSYDQCYDKAITIIHKAETQPDIDELYVECIGMKE